MKVTTGIVEIDLHGMRVEVALRTVMRAVQKVPSSVYRIRVIHGYNSGTALREMIGDEFSYGRVPKVIRIEQGSNPGITELVLREL